MKIIPISTEFIKLGQLLKLIGLISNGSESKAFLDNNQIEVNSIVEKRRGKKLYPKDAIKINEAIYIIG